MYLTVGFIKRIGHLLKAANYDFIFIHRELTPLGFPIFEWFIAHILKKKIIYDFDDAIWLEDPSERGTLIAKLKWKSKIGTICRWSDKVSAGNAYLVNYAKKYNDHVVFNPTTIDTENLHNPTFFKRYNVPSGDKEYCIGWTGTHSTLPYLDMVIPVLKTLEKKYRFKFRVICNKKPDFNLSNLEFIEWNKTSEIADLMDIDIGIMPLTDDVWSKGKCGFKALQYMALEKPALVSPIGVNGKIVDHTITGYHCHSEDDWLKYLSHLLEHPEISQIMGEKGRSYVKKYYSVESNEANFLALFKLP